MRIAAAITVVVLFGACTSDDDAPTSDTGSQPDTAAGDVQLSDGSASADMSAPSDVDDSFCARADCSADQPHCSELLARCVECTADTDCTTAPLFTCETVGTDGSDPSFACVECVDDTVCAGGTCDLTSFSCVP